MDLRNLLAGVERVLLSERHGGDLVLWQVRRSRMEDWLASWVITKERKENTFTPWETERDIPGLRDPLGLECVRHSCCCPSLCCPACSRMINKWRGLLSSELLRPPSSFPIHPSLRRDISSFAAGVLRWSKAVDTRCVDHFIICGSGSTR